MNFEPGQSVIVLDSENKPAGTATVISGGEGGLYKVAFCYGDSDKKEAFELMLPERRLLMNNDKLKPAAPMH